MEMQANINAQLVEIIDEWFENNETMTREDYDDLFHEARSRITG